MQKRLFIVISIAFLMSSYVYARDWDGTYDQFKDTVQDRKQERVEEMEARRLRICEKLEGRIEIKVNRFQENKNTHVEKYQRLKERLGNVLSTLEERGFDVSKLREDLGKLDELIKEYAQLYVEFIDSLEFTRGYACGKSEGDFKDAVAAAREKYRLIKEKRAEIREFYQEVIREDIKELRQQAEDEPAEEEVGEDE